MRIPVRVAELVGKAPAGAKLVLVRYSAAEPLHLKCFFCGGGGARGGTSRRFKSSRFLALVSFFICLTTLLSALLAPSQPTATTIGAGVLWWSLWHCYFFFWVFILEKNRKKERKAAPATGHFASLIGDLTVGRLQLFERHRIFSEVLSGCCVYDCLETKKKKKKTSHCRPKFNAHISAEEKGEKRGAGIYNTWPDVGDISGPGGNVRLWRDIFLGKMWPHHIRLLLPMNTCIPESSCCCGTCGRGGGGVLINH